MLAGPRRSTRRVGFSGTLHLGGTTLTSSGGLENMLLVKLDASGAVAWGEGFSGASGLAAGAGLAIDAAGELFLTGAMEGTVDLGGASLTSTSGQSVLVASFDAAGKYRWAQLSDSSLDSTEVGIAVDPSCKVIIVGNFPGSLDFGGAPLTSSGIGDAFVARFGR